jgi:adenylate kinase
MTQKIVAFVGLSGVGKTSALKILAATRPFQHLAASNLIREARKTNETSPSLETLRSFDIDESQNLLIDGFNKAIDQKAKRIVLDGHTLIETPSGPVKIRAEVFRALRITSMVFLADAPAEILRRREEDPTRSRPRVNVADILHFQEAALLTAFEICVELDVPLCVLTPKQHERLQELLA